MKKNFYCQPNIPNAITCWSYTFMIFLLSLFLWLEITVFQIWTALTFILFVIVTLIQLFFRRVVVTDEKIILKCVLGFNNKEITKKELKNIEMTKCQLRLTDKYQTYSVLMLPKAKKECYELIKSSYFGDEK